jgi:hypothetical protein
MFNFKKFFNLLMFFFILLIPLFNVSAQEEFINKDFCTVYFTGVGCPHCANSDPMVLEDILNDNENVVTIEYEVYQSRLNANLMSHYEDNYKTGYGIPLLIFNKSLNLSGDGDIVGQYGKKVEELESNFYNNFGYAVSGTIVEYIVSDYSYGRLVKLVKEPNNIQAIFGLNKKEFSSNWKSYLIKKYE